MADVSTVREVDTADDDGVTVGGEKLQESPAGNAEHWKETAELNPFAGVTVMATLPLCPPGTVNESGEAAIEKSAGSWIV